MRNTGVRWCLAAAGLVVGHAGAGSAAAEATSTAKYDWLQFGFADANDGFVHKLAVGERAPRSSAAAGRNRA